MDLGSAGGHGPRHGHLSRRCEERAPGQGSGDVCTRDAVSKGTGSALTSVGASPAVAPSAPVPPCLQDGLVSSSFPVDLSRWPLFHLRWLDLAQGQMFEVSAKL